MTSTFCSSLKESKGLISGTGGKSFAAGFLENAFSEHPNLLVVFHDQYLDHRAPSTDRG